MNGQIELLQAIQTASPQAAWTLAKLRQGDSAEVARYDRELDQAKAKNESTERDKRLHQKQGNCTRKARPDSRQTLRHPERTSVRTPLGRRRRRRAVLLSSRFDVPADVTALHLSPVRL